LSSRFEALIGDNRIAFNSSRAAARLPPSTTSYNKIKRVTNQTIFLILTLPYLWLRLQTEIQSFCNTVPEEWPSTMLAN
jgi:hypothetical protein